MTTRGNFQSVSLGSLPPAPDLRFVDPVVRERTVFSPDRQHRFTLFRYWGDVSDYVAGCAINPSGADEVATDNFVAKMCKLARHKWGVGAYYQLNALSIRLTDSTQLSKAGCVNLPENDEWIRRVLPKARFVVVAWGNLDAAPGRGAELEKILQECCDRKKVLCWGKNKNGSPRYPLRLADATELVPYFDSDPCTVSPGGLK